MAAKVLRRVRMPIVLLSLQHPRQPTHSAKSDGRVLGMLPQFKYKPTWVTELALGNTSPACSICWDAAGQC